MNESERTAYDAVIIGGGFYGAAISIYLATQRNFKNILLVEREDKLFKRASYHNQARVHNGYHYPRSFTTAYRSRINLPRFLKDWPEAVKQDFTKVYAIARRNSKVTAKQFERFCHEIGAKISLAEPTVRNLFESRLIEQVFNVEEYAFDSTKLLVKAQREIEECGIKVRLKTRITAVTKEADGALQVLLKTDDATPESIRTRTVFNCSYSGLNQLGGDYPGTKTGLKHEITEMALVAVPPALKDLGITVMDGPFFSIMPFPALNLHTLSHVRYTPHLNWTDKNGLDPYQRLKDYERKTRMDWMLRDVARYIPAVGTAKYVDSLFEVKTVLLKNEVDDGRPILFEKHESLPGCFTILGGKIDNIYDVLEKLDHEKI